MRERDRLDTKNDDGPWRKQYSGAADAYLFAVPSVLTRSLHREEWFGSSSNDKKSLGSAARTYAGSQGPLTPALCLSAASHNQGLVIPSLVRTPATALEQ
jgi:hypothetical protein